MVAVSCTSQSKPKNGLEHVVVSPNDNFILFSYFTNDISSIYSLNISNNKITELFISSSKRSYVNPKFSPKGEKIIFIGYDEGSINSNIFIANVDGTNVKQLTTGNSIITEAVFSSDDNTIYFNRALNYEKYSPIGRKAAHNFDIYSLELETGVEKKLTNIDAYMLSDISEVENKYILMELFQGMSNGMYMFPKEYPDSIKSIIPSNNPRKGLSSSYGNPKYSGKYKMLAFTAPYELYVMNFEDRIANKIYRSSRHIMQISFFHSRKEILFTLQKENLIRCINLDGTGFKKIPIEIPDKIKQN